MKYWKYNTFLYLFVFLFLPGFLLNTKPDITDILPSDFLTKPLKFSENNQKQFNEELESLAQKHKSRAVEWWVAYKRALLQESQKTKKESMCSQFTFFSQIDNFPLRHYSRWKHFKHCDPALQIDISTYPDWLKGKVAFAWLKKARDSNDEEILLKVLDHIVRLSQEKYLKEKYLVQAITIAKKTNHPSLSKWRKKLYKVSPRYIPSPKLSQRLAVAHDFRKARLFKKAKKYYLLILNNPKSSFYSKNQSFKWIRWIHRQQNKHDKRLLTTKQWKTWLNSIKSENKKAQASYMNISLLLAQTQWTANQTQKALNTLDNLEKELISSTKKTNRISLFKVYRLKALIWREKENFKRSGYYFEKALKDPPPSKERLEKAKWEFAWGLYKSGNLEKSETHFKDLVLNSESDYRKSKALFWQGQIQSLRGKTEDSKNTFKNLISIDPYSYYGLLAHYKLKQEIEINKNQPSFHDKNDFAGEFEVAKWLLSLGEEEDALNFLKFQSKKFQKDPQKHLKKWATLFYYMSQARHYFPLFQMVGSLPRKEKTTFFYNYPELLFPLNYTTEIEKASSLFNIEKEMIYALIRQESAWQPRAKSPADAFGLMQLRPFVAKSVAREHGISYKGLFDLYQPEKNILLGTAFLKKQFKKYHSQFVPTMATYNAGRKVVEKWLGNNKTDDSLSFIESIPYQETRTYVRLLIRNFVFYKLLHHPHRKIKFPEWTLHIKKT